MARVRAEEAYEQRRVPEDCAKADDREQHGPQHLLQLVHGLVPRRLLHLCKALGHERAAPHFLRRLGQLLPVAVPHVAPASVSQLERRALAHAGTS